MPLSKIVANSITDDTITTDQIADTSVHGRRNLFINGAMAVDQRNATGQPVGGYGYAVDRWRGYNSGTARYDVSQEAITDLQGFSHCYKLAVTTTQSSYGSDISVPIEQSMEGHTTAHLSFGTSNARSVTISFYVKSSVTGDFACALFNGSPITRSIVQNWTVNTADTWEYKTITFAGDTSGTWRTDNLVGAYVALASIGGSAGTARASAANTWEAGYKNHLSTSDNIFATSSATLRFTGIQIEVGDKATPFEQRSFGEELALCQRYCFVQSNSDGTNYYGFGNGHADSSALFRGFSTFPVTMRAKPSVTSTAANTFFTGFFTPNSSATGLDQAGKDGGYFNIPGSGGTAGKAGRWLSNGTTLAYCIWSAEL